MYKNGVNLTMFLFFFGGGARGIKTIHFFFYKKRLIRTARLRIDQKIRTFYMLKYTKMRKNRPCSYLFFMKAKY